MKYKIKLAFLLITVTSVCLLARVNAPSKIPPYFQDIWDALLDLQQQIDDIQIMSGSFWQLSDPSNPFNYDIYYDAGNVSIGNNLEVDNQIKISGGFPEKGKVLTSDDIGLASWQAPSGGGGGGLNLPYAGSAEVADNPVFSITNVGSGYGVHGENAYSKTHGYLGGIAWAVRGLGEHGHEGALGASSAGVWATHPQNNYYAELGCSSYAAKFNGPIKNVNIAQISSGVAMAWNLSTWEIGIVASSARYKKNIKPLDDNFNKVLQAIPKSFICKGSEQEDVGFIAEEFDALGLKNLVHYKDGQPFSVKYEKIPLYLLEVIKDQENTLKELKAENEALNKRLEVLEKKY